MLRRASRADREPALARFRQDPALPVQVAAWLREGGLEAGRGPRGALYLEPEGGLAFVSELGVVLAHLERPESAEALARRVGPGVARVIVGPRSSAERYWAALASRGASLRFRRAQIAYGVARDGFTSQGPMAPLRTLDSSDLEDVVVASAEMAVEESQDDPARRNPAVFRSRIVERLRRGRDFGRYEANELIFKANVAAIAPEGGHIEGVYTARSHRRRGIGRAGVAWMTEWVLERGERCTLLVNEDNWTARRLYAVLGYEERYPSSTLVAR